MCSLLVVGQAQQTKCLESGSSSSPHRECAPYYGGTLGPMSPIPKTARFVNLRGRSLLVLLLALACSCACGKRSGTESPSGKRASDQPAVPEEATPGAAHVALPSRLEPPLPPGSSVRLGTTRFANPGTVFALAFRPDGAELIVSGDNGTYRFDGTTGQRLGRLLENGPRSFGWLDGDTLLISRPFTERGAEIVLHSAGSGAEVGRWTVGGQSNLDIEVSLDGRMVATFGYRRPIAIYESRTGRPIAQFGEGEGTPERIAFVPGQRQVVSSSQDEALLWNIDTGAVVRRFPLLGNNEFWMGPAGKLMAGIGGNNSVILWDLASGRRVFELPGHPSWLSAGAFSPDGAVFAVAAGEKLVFWDTANGKRLGEWDLGLRAAQMLVYSRDGSRLAAAGHESRVMVWEVATGKPLVPDIGHRSVPSAMIPLPGGKQLVSAGHDGTVRVWDLESGHQLRIIDVGDNLGQSALSDAGDILLAEQDGAITGWNLITGTAAFRLEALPGIVRSMAVDGPHIVTVNEPHVSSIDIAGKQVIAVSAHYRVNVGAATSANGAVAALHHGSVAVLIDPATGKERATLRTPHCDQIEDLAISSGGETVATVDKAGDLRLWNGATGAEAQGFALPTGNYGALAVAPGGHRVAVALSDRIVVWTPDTGIAVALPRLAGWITLSFGPHGEQLLAGLSDGTVVVWTAAQLISQAVPLVPATRAPKAGGACDPHRQFARTTPGRWYRPTRVGDSLEPKPPAQPAVRPAPSGLCTGSEIDLASPEIWKRCRTDANAPRVPTTSKELAVEIPKHLTVASGREVTVPIALRNLTDQPLDMDVEMLFGSPLSHRETRRDGRLIPPKSCGPLMTSATYLAVRLAPNGLARAQTTWSALKQMWPSPAARVEYGTGGRPCSSLSGLPVGRYQVTFEFVSDYDTLDKRRATTEITVTN